MSFVDSNIAALYQVGQEIGHGSYGVVFKARDLKTGELVAIKTCRAVMNDQTDVERTYREVAILSQLYHPNVLQLSKVIPSRNQDDLHLVFPLMRADLHTAITGGVLRPKHKQYIMAQLCAGLGYIHAGDVLHRDLKPQNILLLPDCTAKIADFGLSRLIPKPRSDGVIPLTEMCGTRWYLAPEILQKMQYDKAADVWALGATLCEMLTGLPILRGHDRKNQLQRTLVFLGQAPSDPTTGKPMKEKLQGQPKDAVQMAKSMLQLTPEQRPNAIECLTMDYVKAYATKLIQVKPKGPFDMELSPDEDHPISSYQDKLAEFGQSKQAEESTSSHQISQPSSAPVPVSVPSAEPQEPEEEPVPAQQPKTWGSALQEGFRRCGRLFGRVIGNRVMGALRDLSCITESDVIIQEPLPIYAREVPDEDELAGLMGKMKISAVVPSASYTVFTSAPAEGFQQCSEELLLHLLDNAFGVPTTTEVPPLKLDQADYFFERGLPSPLWTPRGVLLGGSLKRKFDEIADDDEWLLSKGDVEGEEEEEEPEGEEPEGEEPVQKEKEPIQSSILVTPKPRRLRTNTLFWTPTRQMREENEGQCVEILHAELGKQGIKARVTWHGGRHHLTVHAADKEKLEAVMEVVQRKWGGSCRVMTLEEKERQYKRQSFSAKKAVKEPFHG